MITCKVFSVLENKVFDNILSVTVDWGNRQVELLPGHAEFFAAIEAGKIVLGKEGGKDEMEVKDAVCRFENKANTFVVME